MNTNANEWRSDMYTLIDGKRISQEIKDELKEKMAELNTQGIKRCLAVIQVGNEIGRAHV